jgi:hypothetical protein
VELDDSRRPVLLAQLVAGIALLIGIVVSTVCDHYSRNRRGAIFEHVDRTGFSESNKR